MSAHDEDDVLSRATRALRETGSPAAEDVHRTRERVLESMRAARQRRSRAFLLTRVAFPIAAVLVGTTAWAAGTGRLSRVLLGVKGAFVSEPAPVVAQTEAPKSAAAKSGGTNGATPPSALATEAVPEALAQPTPTVQQTPEPVPPIPAPAIPKTNPNAKIAPSTKASAAVEPAPAPVEEDAGSVDLALYKRAHRLHFVDKSYAAALVAWDEYLASSPNGAFVAEARYNRAICLIKVGRSAEAKAALEPFAQGKVAGGYRKDEARALIDALP